jgi:hypothetical protein
MKWQTDFLANWQESARITTTKRAKSCKPIGPVPNTMTRPACEILHDLASELERFQDKCETLFPSELNDLLNEALAHKPHHIPSNHAFDPKHRERKDDI